ncbi:MAG: molybdopterin molybdotransferase MoeA, partial [Planctomycetota bacterium]|nr:molybdopterin molybdotransferase MoeA [Planctomycetota bacterium]
LTLRGELPAGGVPAAALSSGETLRIMTGAPLPEGADAVVPHEITKRSDAAVRFFAPVAGGKNIRRAGGDMQPGDRPLAAGQVLGSSQLAIAAALGYPELRVTRTPRVAILSPGDELVPVGETPPPGKIRSSNAPALAGALREVGAEPVDLGIVPDDESTIESSIRRAFDAGADAVVSSGGVSAGDYDYVRTVVERRADPAHVFKVAMRPGKPQVFGLFDGRPFFGLPGNPASSIISFEVFVRPAIRKMRGERDVLPPTFGVRFPFDYSYKPGRVFLLRARVEEDPAGGFRVVPPGSQDSSFLASLARANVVIVLPAEGGRVAAGELRPAFWLSSYRP